MLETAKALRGSFAVAIVTGGVLVVACGGSSGSGGGGSPVGGAGGSSASIGGSGGTSGGAGSGTTNDPKTGCLDGYDACGDVCAHLADDPRDCGKCGKVCDESQMEGCVDGQCAAGMGCMLGLIRCEGACVQPATDADNCASCSNRCADTELCTSPASETSPGECVKADGNGTSCASAVVVEDAWREGVGFRMSTDVTTTHRFACGPAQPITTRWFRLPLMAPHSTVKLRTDDASDDYVLELFSEAPCIPMNSVACDDQSGTNGAPTLFNVPTSGQSYYLAVGVKGTWSGRSAVIYW